MNDETYLRMAIQKAAEGIERGQTPFGAVIVKDGTVVASEHNRVWSTGDITAHAEILAIREACKRLNTIVLTGCTVYSSCEPCPMCFSACHWAQVSRIVYGARIDDAKAYGFHELTIPAATMHRLGGNTAILTGDLLREESLELFRRWSRRADRRPY